MVRVVVPVRPDPAAARVGERRALSLSAGRDRFVSVAALQDLLARWAAPLPRARQPDDARRRAAVAVACALAEPAAANAGHAGWDTAERGVAERADALAESAGLTSAQVQGALALLVAAAAVERISAGGERRLRLADGLVAEEPALARVAWPVVRDRIRAAGASVLPAQAVLRAIARQSGAVPAGGTAPVISCTQESLAHETLLGRTAVVSALRALVEAGLMERAARRGTWTECRLLPAAYGAAAPSVRAAPPDREVPLGFTVDGESLPAAPAARSPGDDARAPVAAGMTLEVGGVRVPLAPGTTVEPPPGATITIEIDADGRRFVSLGPGIRLGPLA